MSSDLLSHYFNFTKVLQSVCKVTGWSTSLRVETFCEPAARLLKGKTGSGSLKKTKCKNAKIWRPLQSVPQCLSKLPTTHLPNTPVLELVAAISQQSDNRAHSNNHTALGLVSTSLDNYFYYLSYVPFKTAKNNLPLGAAGRHFVCITCQFQAHPGLQSCCNKKGHLRRQTRSIITLYVVNLSSI